MVNTKCAMLVDRRVYAFKGKWKNPQEDTSENIFYFFSQPFTMVETYQNGRETLKRTCEITIFGGKAICERDIITLQDGTEMRVASVTPNYFESNILIRDMLKQRIESMVVVLGEK